MIYVYAVLDARSGGASIESPGVDTPRGAQDGTGAESPSLRSIDGLVVAYRDVDEAPIASTERVLDHERVVEALMRRDTLLPCRFGTTFKNLAGLDDVLRRHKHALAPALDRVRGHVELGLRVIGLPSNLEQQDDSPPTSGRDYLLRRLGRERERSDAERLAEEIESPLLRLCRDHTRRVLPSPAILMVASYLVPADRIEAFRDAVVEMAPRFPQVRFLCSGPWPPYNFVPKLRHAEEPHVAPA